MDDTRLGAAVRVLRSRRGWSQAELSRRAVTSRATVSRVERGLVGRVTLDALRAIGSALGVRLVLDARWQRGDLSRLLDAAHAELVEAVIGVLRRAGWTAVPEVSFSIYGERGSIDVLAWHPGRRALLVVEVKSRIVDVQGLLAGLDRKRRLVPRIARDRGWVPAHVGAWLAVGDTRTNRRRLAEHRDTFATVLPRDGRALRRWLRTPDEGTGFIGFLPFAHHARKPRGR